MNTERTLQAFADEIVGLRKQLKEREGDWISCAYILPANGSKIFCKNVKGGVWAEVFDNSEPNDKLAYWMLIKYPLPKMRKKK
jgi:hypothetical protein